MNEADAVPVEVGGGEVRHGHDGRVDAGERLPRGTTDAFTRSYVKIVDSKEKGEAAVESVTTAAKNGGVFKRHEYRVQDGLQGIFITTTLRNETDKPQKVFTKSDFTRFDYAGTTTDGIYWTDAINPAHKCGYAVGTLNVTGAGTATARLAAAYGAVSPSFETGTFEVVAFTFNIRAGFSGSITPTLAITEATRQGAATPPQNNIITQTSVTPPSAIVIP
jgi:hypothetical protein